MTEREVRVSLPPMAPSIGVARRLVRDAASDLPAALVADAELLTSELVTNAIRYGGPTIGLTIAVDDDCIRVEVDDDGPQMPTRGPADPDLVATSGRGLRIVEQVAGEWGIRSTGGGPGKTVWFILSASGLRSARPVEQTNNQ